MSVPIKPCLIQSLSRSGGGGGFLAPTRSLSLGATKQESHRPDSSPQTLLISHYHTSGNTHRHAGTRTELNGAKWQDYEPHLNMLPWKLPYLPGKSTANAAAYLEANHRELLPHPPALHRPSGFFLFSHGEQGQKNLSCCLQNEELLRCESSQNASHRSPGVRLCRLGTAGQTKAEGKQGHLSAATFLQGAGGVQGPGVSRATGPSGQTEKRHSREPGKGSNLGGEPGKEGVAVLGSGSELKSDSGGKETTAQSAVCARHSAGPPLS